MSGPSKVIVLDPDPRAGRLVQLGFEREGIGFTLADPGAIEIPPEAGAMLVGGTDGAAVDLIKRAKAALQAANLDIPIIAASRGTARATLEAAGADAVLTAPTYLRDVVTVCRILHGVPAQKRDHLVGNLAETTGSYSLVRALASLGKSGVLTLIRGLRRGEVRFYTGEVTSAELGVIHGQAAFHQLLLWTDARFDFAHHETVRRQQIPLSPEELFADAERFLEGVRDAAGNLSPATVLEQDLQRITDLGKHIPTEVFGVLRMFDGHRVLADILEDSPYRVFETLRVAQKAVEVGLLRRVESQRPKATWRAVLAIDEWLVGNETRDSVVERTAELDSGPNKTGKHRKTGGKKTRVKRAKSTPGVKSEIDWGALVPRVIGAEVGPLSGVVPALAAHGEVEAPTRDRAREKLEALMDTDKRDRIFPTEIGLEPKVVIAGMEPEPKPVTPDEVETVKGSKRKQKKDKTAAEAAAKEKIAEEMARIEAERAVSEAARLEAERVAAQKAAAELAAVDAEKAAAAERIAKEKIAAEMARIEAERVAEAERAAKEKIAAEMARIEAERVANEKAAAEEKRVAEQKAAAEKAQAERELAESQARIHENVERMRLERLAREEADAKAAAEAAITANTSAVEDARAYAARVKAAAEARRKEADAAVIEAAHATPRESASEARDLVRGLVADAMPSKPAEPAFLATPPANVDTAASRLIATPSSDVIGGDTMRGIAPTPTADAAASHLIATPTSPTTADTDRDIAVPMTGDTMRGVIPAAVSGATTLPVRSADDALTKPFVRAEVTSDPFTRITDPVTVVESAQTSVAVSDVVTVNRTSDTAMVTASPRVLISETPTQAPVASMTPAIAVSSKIDDATPEATDDEPSDGVILAPIATADTARVAARARAMRAPEPAHEGPPVKEATGEIGDRHVRTGIQEKIELEPSILINDLGAAHTAVAAAVAKTAATPAPGDAASASKELDVATVRRDAVAFSEDEEAFFKRAEGGTAQVPKFESFDDLDEGYEPTSFWGKVFGGKKKPPPR